MVATDMQKLEAMLKKEMKSAMKKVSRSALRHMQDEVNQFYNSPDPVMYHRTGALWETPTVSEISETADAVSFDAYLDTRHQYTTGKQPNMLDVLRLANNGITQSSVGTLRPTVGQGGFWERAEEKIEQSFLDEMKKRFK